MQFQFRQNFQIIRCRHADVLAEKEKRKKTIIISNEEI